MNSLKSRILCVDDEPMNLSLLEAMLAPRGFAVVLAANGLEALERIRQERVDIVLLDVMMPEMDGFEVCRRIKSDERYGNIPVIMITGYAARENRIKGIEAGAEDFISKPFDSAEVMARINMLLKVKALNDQLNAAYGNITNLVTFGEKIVATFDPLHFDIMSTVTRIVSQIIASNPEMPDRPQVVLVSISEGTESGSWLRFEYRGSNLVMTPIQQDLRRCFPLSTGGERVFFCNENDLARPEWEELSRTLAESAVVPLNLICHLNDRLSLCALNYGRQITRFDVEVLNSVVAQCLFLQSLSCQVRKTEDAFAYTVHALARASEANDEDTGDHILRVGEYSALLARRLGMPEEFVSTIRLQAQMHDIGKVHTPSEILKKPGQFTPEEFESMKLHTIQGTRILGNHIRLNMASNIALSHHERYDGSGYPHGLSGEEIPIEARIVSLADQYDALRNPRVYKPAFGHATTCQIILEGDGRTLPQHFDPVVLDAFRELSDKFAEIYESLSQQERH